MPNHEEIKCPRCGSPFECKMGSITICHCSDVHLSREQMAFISEHWQGCLCHACLLEIKTLLPENPSYRARALN
ncbi:cysteine-rich CWC family protein [Oleiphilus sp. HI0125]|uniref:cysteine-rich CWC family protein n=1 Tax=Oleiphilus sp. HI0125 TaxID=1822266 RepID=UPI0009ED483E